MKLDQFGGLSTLFDPTNLPVFASPDCQDVEFLRGLVRTRPGTSSIFAALGGNPTVNYLKTYITPTVSDALRTLVLDSLGNFWKEDATLTPGVLSLVSSSIVPASYANSVSLFGREYIAIGDGQYGIDIPRQYDDMNFDRVSQEGPGAAPQAVDENQIATIAAAGVPGAQQLVGQPIATGPTGAVETGNLVTITTTGPHGLLPGVNVTIAGVGVAGYNGTFVTASVFSPTVFTVINGTAGLAASGGGTASNAIGIFTTTAPHGFVPGQLITIAGVGVAGYNGTFNIFGVTATQFEANLAAGGLANSGGGTATAVGNIIAGKHLLSVMFVTRSGYITAPAPFAGWISSGGKRVVVTNIPVGPPNVTQRIIIFTAAGGESFFYTTSPSVVDFTTIVAGGNPIFSSNMVIADNVTTTATFDFSDATLLEGTNADNLFNLLELGECSGVTEYSSRLFWTGERSKVENILNFEFDGGFQGLNDTRPLAPLGWIPTITPTASQGVNSALAAGQPVYYGDALFIFGDGASATRGNLTQSLYQDSFGDPILAPNTAYSIRAKIRKGTATLTAGTLQINAVSALAAISTTGILVPFSTAPSVYTEFIVPFFPSTAVIPKDLVIRIQVSGTPNNGAGFLIDDIELFPTAQPINTTIIRASGIEDPESYDGVTGFLQPGIENGQACRCCFTIRGNLYMVKDRSLYVTQDDGTNEPSSWTIGEVSLKVGTLSVRGVAVGDEWAIIAGLDGVYYFDGSAPTKISEEIQPTWDSINWALGYLIDVRVDTKRQRIYIAVPLGASAAANNTVLTLDYVDGFGDPSPTNTVNIAGIGRKWAPWNIPCNSMNFILRNTGIQQLWFGNATNTGKINQLDTTGTIFSDDQSSVLVTDDFNRPDENPLNPAKWTADPTLNFTPLQVVSHRCEPVGPFVNGAGSIYTGISWPADQSPGLTVFVLATANDSAGIVARSDATMAHCYFLNVIGPLGVGTAEIDLQVFDGDPNNSVSQPVTITGHTVLSGDNFVLQPIGDVISILQNGVLIASIIDSTLSSGSGGIFLEAGDNVPANCQVGNFVGGGGGVESINSYWQSAYFQDVGRLTFGPLVANVVGSGACGLILRKGDQGWITNLRGWSLKSQGFHNMERMLNIETERLALRFGTNAIGDHFSLQGIALYAKQSPFAVLRGINS